MSFFSSAESFLRKIIPIVFFVPASIQAGFLVHPAETHAITSKDSTLTDSSANQIPKRKYFTKPVAQNAPAVDGRLDDECWKGGSWQGGFTQREPRSGDKPTEETEIKILYDEANLYVAIRAYDKEPGKIDFKATRRDDYSGDIVGVALDTYFDHRTAVEFDLNAAGLQTDLVLLNNGQAWDLNWDAVWYGKTSREDSAWTAEMQIPFSQLRFNDKEEQVWGLHFWRWINRRQEEDNWQYIPKDSPGMVHLYGELHGLKNIKSSIKAELLPYAVGKMNTFRKEEGNPFATGRTNTFSAGLDGKLGITSDLTLDFAINPDFGQVEADPSTINLTSFETFYNEKRPFFLEGRNILDFNIGEDDILFYSRRIGHSPSYSPPSFTDEYVRMPEMTSIISALKLTGKTRDGSSLGFISGLTAKENAQVSSSGQEHSVAVEPLTHYFVGRLQKDYNQGNTVLGGMLTSVNRSISDSHLSFLNNWALTGGLDLKHQWDNKTYYLDVKTLFSHIRGDKQAISDLQQSSVHNFQRPDAGHLKYDASLNSLSGYGGSIEAGKEGNGFWRFSESLSWKSPGFDVNDIGYLKMADIIIQYSVLGYVVNVPNDLLLNYALHFDQYSAWDFGGDMLYIGGKLELGAQFHNFWSIYFEIERVSNMLDTRILRGGPALLLNGNWEKSFSFATDRAKRLSFSLSMDDVMSTDEIFRYTSFSPGLFLRFGSSFGLSANVNYNFRRSGLQYVATVQDNGSKYIMGQIDQKTLGLTLRLDYNITPELSVQYYASPFISAGHYYNFKRITSARAEGFNERFHLFSFNEIYKDNNGYYQVDEDHDRKADYGFSNPDFNFRQFRSNLVLRWEYKAGSTVYLVWSQGRTGFEGTGEFSWEKDMRGLYDVYPDDIFLIKFNHWFSL